MKLQRVILTGQDVQGQSFKVIAHIGPSGMPQRLICDRYAVPYKNLDIFQVPVGDVEKFKRSDLGFFKHPHSALMEIFKMPILFAQVPKTSAGRDFNFLMSKFIKK